MNNQKPLFLESVCVCVCVRTHARLNNQKPLFLEDVCVCVCVCVYVYVSVLSNIRLLANPQTVGHQAPLSMGFSKQEYWSGLPFPPSGDLPNPGIKLMSLVSPALAGRFFTTSATWEPIRLINDLGYLPRKKNSAY